MLPITSFDKAIAGGIVSAIVALVARFGFQADPQTVNALTVLVTAVVAYAVGHLAVYFKSNK